MVQLQPARAGGVVRARSGPAARRAAWAAELRRRGLSDLGRNVPGGALLVFDHDLRFVEAGGRGLADVGLSRRMLEGKTVRQAFGPALAADMEPAFRLALGGEDAELEMVYEGKRLLQRLTAVSDSAGVIVGGMTFVQDVSEARAHEQALRESVEQFRLAFDNAPIGKAIVELDGTFREVNPALCTLTGYQADQLMAMRFQDITHPDDLNADLDLLEELLRGERSAYQLEKRYRKPTGEYVWALLAVALVRSADGAPMHLISQIQDMSERKRHELQLLEAHAFQEAVFAASPDVFHIHDVTRRRAVWTSRSVTETLGYAPDELIQMGDGLETFIIPEVDQPRFRAAVRRACLAADGDVVELRHRVRHGGGLVRWVSNRMTPFQRDDAGIVTQLLGVSHDVTELVAAEERLETAALHDDLTGLPNRRLINRRLGELLARTDRPGANVVLFCDLDGFKRVNDAHGHQIGDALLRESATRLVSATRGGDTVGRMGGDEFVVLLPVSAHEDPATLGAEVAERIIRAVGQPVLIGGTEHTITTSIGICLAQPGASPEDLLRDADTAMYQAKLNGKDGHATFEPGLRQNACTRDALVRQIRQALADNSLEVYYQPIVDPTTDRVMEVEALVRLPGADGQFLDTAAAVSVAEQTGLMSAVGERVLRQACQQTSQWRQLPEHAHLRVAVNLSAAEIARPGLYDRVTGIVRSTGMDLTGLTLEITETVLLDAAPGTLQDLRRLHADGVGIAIDDFGTGYAGLRYLATLPVTEIKVDRSFTAQLPDDATSATIIRATIGLATDLRLACIVEGVETHDQLAALPAVPGLLVQGYLFSRPQPGGAVPPPFIVPD